MTDIRVVSPAEHANKRWFKPTNYSFTARDRLMVLGLSEIPKAMMSVPLAFAKHNGQFVPVVMQSFTDGQNLLVTAGGQWVADYIPLLYRSYPFKLAKNTEGQFVLCIDHDSGLITDTPAGFQFFGEGNSLSAEVTAIASQLMQFEAERTRSMQLCKLLDEQGVIDSWPIQLQEGTEVRTAEGIYRINEQKLNQITGDALAEIRNLGGLMVCYAQLFSMQHLQQMGNVAQRTHWANNANAGASKVAALNIVDDNGILSFANL
jgi:hypothetical protein